MGDRTIFKKPGSLCGATQITGLDMAVVARSKDAGINRSTLDIIFASGENYESALRSNVFEKEERRRASQHASRTRGWYILHRHLRRH
jgi:hypothetical protein